MMYLVLEPNKKLFMNLINGIIACECRIKVNMHASQEKAPELNSPQPSPTSTPIPNSPPTTTNEVS